MPTNELTVCRPTGRRHEPSTPLAANMPHAGNSAWHTFVDYDHTPTKYGEAKSTANTFLTGIDRGVDAGRASMSVGYQKYSTSFGTNAGGFDIKRQMQSACTTATALVRMVKTAASSLPSAMGI